MSPFAQAQLLRQGCEQLAVNLTDDMESACIGHLELLSKWNKTHNLTAITDHQGMVVQHLLDSLSILPWIKGEYVLDVGTGGGFPGLPLAICRPDLQTKLLDSRGKRVEFLRFCVTKLQLGNVSLENARIENYQPQLKFDTLTARAFTALPTMLKLCRHCLTPGTRLLAMKGVYPHAEISEIENWAGFIKLDIKTQSIRVPFLEAERHLVVIDVE